MLIYLSNLVAGESLQYDLNECVSVNSISLFKLGCASGWLAYNGHCYIRTSTQLSFHDAHVSLFFNPTRKLIKRFQYLMDHLS